MNIHPALSDHVNAAHKAGFTILIPATKRPASYVYVTRAEMPGMALMQAPSFPSFEPVNIDVPVAPNKVWGSCVGQDYDGTPQGAIDLLFTLASRSTVVPRFVGDVPAVPVDRRIPKNATPYAG